jgi:hypothetical protein
MAALLGWLLVPELRLILLMVSRLGIQLAALGKEGSQKPEEALAVKHKPGAALEELP